MKKPFFPELRAGLPHRYVSSVMKPLKVISVEFTLAGKVPVMQEELPRLQLMVSRYLRLLQVDIDRIMCKGRIGGETYL